MSDQKNIYSQWDTTTLGELIDKDNGSIQTGPFGTTLKAAEYTKNGVPLISVRELVDGRIEIDQKTPKVNQHILDRLPQYILQKGDIVFGRKGSVERSALIREREHGWFLGSDGIRIRLHECVDTRFIHYQVRSKETSTWLLQHASGTTMPSLNQKILRKLPLTLPPLPEQKAIASILGSLDNKIELNNKMNETLETMARALYKSWFVDFDPVVAKAAGKRPYGMDDKTAALFPDRFVDSELGPIPEGWEIVKLSNEIELNPKVELQKNGKSPYLSMQNVIPFRIRPTKWEWRQLTSGVKFENGDTLVARITPSLENGKTIMVDFLPDDQPGWGSTEFLVLRNKGRLSPSFIYFMARGNEFRDIAIASMIGSSGRQRVQNEAVKDFLFSIPDSRNIFDSFENFSSQLIKTIKYNDKESQTLSQIRDLLLPKLISGEIRIKDAEKVVEEAL